MAATPLPLPVTTPAGVTGSTLERFTALAQQLTAGAAAPAVPAEAPSLVPTPGVPALGTPGVEVPAVPPVEAPPVVELDLEAAIAEAAKETGQAPPKVKEAWTSYQTLQELAKPEAEGGIGHVPQAAQIREYYNGAVSFSAMMRDLQQGNLDNFVAEASRWAPGLGESLAQKFGVVKPETEAEMAQKGAEGLLVRLWGDVQATQDPAQKAYWTNIANQVYRYMTGVPMPSDGPKFQAGAPVDPELAKVRQENAQLRQRGDQEAAQNWERAYNGQVREVVGGMIEEALKPWRNADGTPRVAKLVYEGLQQAFMDQVRGALQSNQFVTNQLGAMAARAKAVAGRDPATGQQILADAVRMVKVTAAPIIASTRQSIGQKAVQPMPAVPKAPPAAPAVAAGVPVAAGVAPAAVLERKPGQGRMDYLTQAFVHAGAPLVPKG